MWGGGLHKPIRTLYNPPLSTTCRVRPVSVRWFSWLGFATWPVLMKENEKYLWTDVREGFMFTGSGADLKVDAGPEKLRELESGARRRFSFLS